MSLKPKNGCVDVGFRGLHPYYDRLSEGLKLKRECAEKIVTLVWKLCECHNKFKYIFILTHVIVWYDALFIWLKEAWRWKL